MGMLAGVICLTAMAFLTDNRWKLIAIVGFFSGVSLSILSGSRGGWLALFVVVCTLLYQLSKTNKAAVKVLLASFLVVAIVVFIEWKHLPIEKKLHQTLNSLHEYFSGENKATSLGARFEMWRASWYAFLDKPLFGWGWDRSDDYFKYFFNKGIIQLPKLDFGHPHSQYFLFLGQMGLLGFIAFISMLIYPIQYFIRTITAFNKTANISGAFICLLPLAIHEAVMEFSLSDDSLSQRQFLLILTTMTLFCISLISRAEESAHPASR
jgi:O-antigen ligase